MKKSLTAGKGLVLALMAAIAVPAAQASGGEAVGSEERPGQAVEEGLGQYVTPRVQSEVMVFGSWHLAAFRDWLEPQQLEGTLAMLERFAPTRIAIERIPPDEVALLAELAPHNEMARQTLDRFGRATVPSGRAMQQALGVDRIAAAIRADDLLENADASLEPTERVELIGHLLAAYEFDSATLQWSYLAPSERGEADALPEDVSQALDERLQAADEAVTLAMPLARRLGLQRLYQTDSQYETVRLQAFPPELVDEVYGGASEMTDADGTIRRMLEKPDGARDRGEDLLAVGLDVNTHTTQLQDTTQWVPWLTMDHPSGLDRERYAMWELRNQRMATHIMDVAASTEPERVVFIVGFSHKSYVDRVLEPNLAIRLVQPEAYAR
ncbi:MAG: DUF5694 domain-containing protein [Luteimonas sp.]